MPKSSNKNIIRKIISNSSDEYKSSDELRRQLNSLKINGSNKPDELITIDSIQKKYYSLIELPQQKYDKDFLNVSDNDELSFFRIYFHKPLDNKIIDNFIEKIKQQYFYGFKQGSQKQEDFSTTVHPSDVDTNSVYNFFDSGWENAAETLANSNLENAVYSYSYENYLEQEAVQNLISFILISYSYEQADEIINNLPASEEIRSRIKQLYYNNRVKSTLEKQQSLNIISNIANNKEIFLNYKNDSYSNVPYGIQSNIICEKEIDLGIYKLYKKTINEKKAFDELLISSKALEAVVFENENEINTKIYESQKNTNSASFLLGKEEVSSELFKFINKNKLNNLINKFARSYKQIFNGELCFRQRIGFIVSKYKNKKLIKTIFLETEDDLIYFMDQQVPYYYNYTYKFEQCELIIGNNYEYFDRLFPIITSLTEIQKLQLQKIKQLISISYLIEQNLLYKYKTNFAIDLQKINQFISTNEFKGLYNYNNINFAVSNKQLVEVSDYSSLDKEKMSNLTQTLGSDALNGHKGLSGTKIYNDLIKDYFSSQQAGILSYKLWDGSGDGNRLFDIDKIKLNITEEVFNNWKILEEGKTETQFLAQNDSFGLFKNEDYYPRLYNNHIDFCVKNTKVLKLIKHEIFKAEEILVQSKPPLAPSIDLIGFKDINNKIKFNFIHNSGELKETSIELNYEPYMNVAQFREKDDNGLVSFSNDEAIKNILIFKTDKEPSSYKDFNFYQIQDNILGSFNEYIEPNKKYWYTFVAQDNHGLYSNPSIIYQVEILSQEKLCYVVSSLFSFKKKEALNTFYIKNNLKITPNYKHIIPLDDKDLQSLILKNGNIFTKIFKFRVRSLSTNKIIDINVDVNKELQK